MPGHRFTKNIYLGKPLSIGFPVLGRPNILIQVFKILNDYAPLYKMIEFCYGMLMEEPISTGKTGKLLSFVRTEKDYLGNSPELNISIITDFYASLSPEEREALADFLTLEHTREFPGAKFLAESTRLEAKYGPVLRSAEDKFEALRQQFGVNFLDLRNFILDKNLFAAKSESTGAPVQCFRNSVSGC